MNRRKFIQNTAVVAAGTMFMPAFLKACQMGAVPKGDFKGKRLIVVQFSGGNDGLNSIVPHGNDIYYQKRPQIAIPKNEVIRLDDMLGLHPALQPLKALWDDGDLNILNNVGYPNPDRSHFRSMDIWHTASDANEYLSTGWLGRYLDGACQGCGDPHHALELDDQLSLVLKGINRSGFAMSNPQQLYRMVKTPVITTMLQHHHEHEHHEHVAYLYKTLNSTNASAEYLFEKAKVYKSNVTYPQTDFGKDLKQVAELMIAGCDAQIYYVTLGGFDTHAGQNVRQQNLLKQYAEGITALVKDLKQAGLWNDTLVMTFSEFGRRVAENGSRGTDHGTANNLYLMGGSLKKGGFFNEAPNLTDLDEGDLKFQLDFRRVYATILKNWLQVSNETVLGKNFELLDVI